MKITSSQITCAATNLKSIVHQTPLTYNKRLSQKYGAQIYFKREDQQDVRSFKIRGAYNKMVNLTKQEKSRGVVAASAGNHAQGVALSCSLLKIPGTIFMPTVTPNQKINKVKHFGGKYVDIQIIGDSFDEAAIASQKFCKQHKTTNVHPFDDLDVIAGQGTIGQEIYQQLQGKVDTVIVPVGGGGLLSGIASYLTQQTPNTKLYGIESSGAASMYTALKNQQITTLETIDTFVDGTAVKTAGQTTYQILHQLAIPILKVPEGQVCTTMIDLYQNEGIVTEPAGALSIAALDELGYQLKGKTVVCILSGGNNDLLRYPEILEKSLIHQGRKHYFVINFAQKPGQLKNLLTQVLGPNDDIVRFEYVKKTNAEKGPAFVGIQLADKKDLKPLLTKFDKNSFDYQKIEPNDILYKYLV
jgi:threonine dehydratase